MKATDKTNLNSTGGPPTWSELAQQWADLARMLAAWSLLGIPVMFCVHDYTEHLGVSLACAAVAGLIGCGIVSLSNITRRVGLLIRVAAEGERRREATRINLSV